MDWLESKHTFSFNTYHDPEHTHFRRLRVINEDKVRPGQGFATHSHRDMEILTWVISGALEHRDSLGNGSVIRPGDLQRMSAGSGIMHSEFNHSDTEPVHFLQIWIFPARKGIKPGYEQKTFDRANMQDKLLRIASSDDHAALTIHQDVDLYGGILSAGKTLAHTLERGGFGWVQVTAGSLNLNGITLDSGDGAAISGERSIEFISPDSAEFLLFDLA